MSVLVNGSPTEEFAPTKGLGQGDPLALYLFLIIGEILSLLITRAEELGIFEGVKFSFFHETFTHFQYADDTILFVHKDNALLMA